MSRPLQLCAITICLLVLTAGRLLAATAAIELPLTLRTALLQQTLTHYINPETDKPAVLYQEGPYRYLHSESPRFEIRHGQPHFISRLIANLGVNVMGVMPMGVNWTGTLDMTLSPYVDEQWQLRYHIVDSVIDDRSSAKPVLDLVWDLVKQYMHPKLEKYSLDLAPPRQEILDFLQACATPSEAERLNATLKTASIGKLRIDDHGIVVPLRLAVTEGDAEARPTQVQTEAPLSPEELENFQKVLEPWDAFLVFVIKNAGMDMVDEQMRSQLFDLLISSRFELLPILTGETRPAAIDPLRILFVDAWQRFRLIIETGEQRGLIQQQAIRYMTFVNAGDALLALDAAAPQLGMQITTDGLRRLARTLQPAAAGDPLSFSWEVDPKLRELFQFGPEPEAVALAPSISQRILDMLIPLAFAAADADQFKSLDRWVPRDEEMANYQQLLGQLLQTVAEEELQREKLDSRYTEVYRHLVPAAALMESCWRQFVSAGGEVTYLRSQAGSIGLMQINQNVWRGFYNLERLRWEVAYNTGAGAQILMRYLKQYGIAVADKNKKITDAPRATYCVYNAGPNGSRRFMKKDSSAREKRVDNRFWTIYQGVAAGGKVDLGGCDVDMP